MSTEIKTFDQLYNYAETHGLEATKALLKNMLMMVNPKNLC